ncbi:DUF2637 domain-containing protein [Specibacter sp. RAF43]|uniref:DUF2637 domain-containing protein n=1 Tax=Specibacter sp. RAF43 TaxID=3233057 RepID=UPI003F9B4579
MNTRTLRAETAAGPVLIAVAIAGTLLSFMGILRLALHVGWPAWAAWLLPISIDGMVVAGILQVLQATAAGTSRKYGWWLTAAGAAISVAANSITATPGILASVDSNILAALTHALPVITVVATLEAWLYMRRGGIHRAAEDLAAADREAALTVELVEAQATVAAGVEENNKLAKLVARLEADISKVTATAATPAAVEANSTPKQKALASVPDAKPATDRTALVAQATTLREGGMTLPAIAAEVGMSLSSVKRLLSPTAATSAA